MKIVISENQYQRLIEAEERPKILKFPSLEFFDENREVAWNIIQKIIERKGNPPYSIEGDLRLYDTPIKSLGSLQSVGGYLTLQDTSIESLGNLKSVGGDLFLRFTSIKSLGNLKSVGRDLFLKVTPISKMYTEKQIRKMVNVGGEIYL